MKSAGSNGTGCTTPLLLFKFLPIAAAGVAALAISFVSIFVVAFGQFVVPGWILIIPAWCLVPGAWCLVIAGSLFAWLRTSPTVLLEVDEYHQRLTVRQPGRRARDPIDLASVQSIAARGDNVVLECGSAPLELSCSGESEAKWLRDWLWERWRGGSRD